MANYATLKAAVQAVVKTNGNQEITGANMQTTLLSIINSLGAAYQFVGVATPSTTPPSSPDYNIAYIAGSGSYTNFGTAVVIPPTNIAIFKYNGSWVCEQVTVENGGIFNITAYNNNTTYADLAAALGTGGANVPEGVRKGGMSIKFVQSSDNKYAQYRLMATSFSTTESDWQGVDDEPTAGSDNLVKSNGIHQANNQLGNRITNETNRAIEAETQLGNRITNETNRALTEETRIEGRLDTNRFGYNVTVFGLVTGVHTLATAVKNVPSTERFGGQKITFKTDSGWVTYQNTSLDISDYENVTNWVPDSGVTELGDVTITNNPDYEDLTQNEGGQLKFADKEYNAVTYSGLGRVYLRKNIVGGVNTLTQEMLADANTIYIIQYDYVLGEDITVPANCVLKFEGGSISAGSGQNMDTITGTNTGINAGLVKIFNTNITLAGSWNVSEAYPEWFGAKADGTIDCVDALQKLIDFIVDGYINSCIILHDGIYRTTKGLHIGKKCIKSYAAYYDFENTLSHWDEEGIGDSNVNENYDLNKGKINPSIIGKGSTVYLWGDFDPSNENGYCILECGIKGNGGLDNNLTISNITFFSKNAYNGNNFVDESYKNLIKNNQIGLLIVASHYAIINNCHFYHFAVGCALHMTYWASVNNCIAVKSKYGFINLKTNASALSMATSIECPCGIQVSGQNVHLNNINTERCYTDILVDMGFEIGITGGYLEQGNISSIYNSSDIVSIISNTSVQLGIVGETDYVSYINILNLHMTSYSDYALTIGGERTNMINLLNCRGYGGKIRKIANTTTYDTFIWLNNADFNFNTVDTNNTLYLKGVISYNTYVDDIFASTANVKKLSIIKPDNITENYSKFAIEQRNAVDIDFKFTDSNKGKINLGTSNTENVTIYGEKVSLQPTELGFFNGRAIQQTVSKSDVGNFKKIYDLLKAYGLIKYADGASPIPFKGTTRPTLDGYADGFMFYDQTLGKPIWWTGATWVDATGATV